MNFILLLLAVIPLPTTDQRLMLHKQEVLNPAQRIMGDYWDPGHDFDVLNYDIDITVDIPADSVWAQVTITAEVLSEDLDTMNLHFHWPFFIESIIEDGRELGWKLQGHDFDIALDRPVDVSETLSVVIFYHGKPGEQDGLFIAENEGDSAVTFVDAEPQGARHWIPCYDEPSDKATFTQRVTVPAGYDVVANGTLEGFEEAGEWWSYTWQEHYPQPTYLIVFAASRHFVTQDMTATVEGSQVPMRVWVLGSHDTREKFSNTPQMVEYFSEIFPPYPFADEKYDQVHAPLGGAMENTTCTFINTFFNWGGGNWDYVLAHELSHDWWGDWLTCATWADLWLNEGFATFCEALWWEHLYGDEGYQAYTRSTMDIYLEYGQSHPVYDPPWGDLFGVVTYDKAGSVLHMMRQVLGDEVFFAGLNEYAWRNANEAVVTDDFQAVMEEVADEDLDWFFDEWIYGPGHPHYEIGWQLLGGQGWSADNQIEFAIAQTQNQLTNYFPYVMPLEIGVYYGETEEIIGFIDSVGYQRFVLDVGGEPDSVVFDPYDKALYQLTVHPDIEDVPFVPTDTEEVTDVTGQLSVSADAVFSSLVNISFNQPSVQQVRLLIYDATGREVKLLYQGKSTDFHRSYLLADLPEGLYFVHLQRSDGSAVSAKTVKLR